MYNKSSVSIGFKFGRNEQADPDFSVKLTWLVYDWLLNLDNESDNKPVTAHTIKINNFQVLRFGLMLTTLDEIDKLTHIFSLNLARPVFDWLLNLDNEGYEISGVSRTLSFRSQHIMIPTGLTSIV